MSKSRENSFLWTDILIVFVIDIILFAIIILFKTNVNGIFTPAIRTALYSSLIGTFGALLGFLITALSILLGIKENEYIKALKETQHFANICSIYLNTSIWLGIATLFSIIALILNKHTTMVITISAVIYPICIARVARCLQMLKRIINISNS